jgi:hypothetical protein
MVSPAAQVLMELQLQPEHPCSQQAFHPLHPRRTSDYTSSGSLMTRIKQIPVKETRQSATYSLYVSLRLQFKVQNAKCNPPYVWRTTPLHFAFLVFN